jgi:hypothetical protein
MIRERLLEARPRDAGFFVGTAAAGVGNHGENMGSNCEPDETDHIWSVESHREMEFTLHSLRSLVCDLLRTNQELRDALFDARIDIQRSGAPPSRNRSR